MSIINDALKKVQQNLSSGDQPATPPTSTPETKYVSPFDQPAITSVTTPPLIKDIRNNYKIYKNLSAAIICLLIITLCAYVAWIKVKDMPQIKEWQAILRANAKHTDGTKPASRQSTIAKPLAQVTVAQAPSPTTPDANSNTIAVTPVAETKATPPLTLNIHGVMANGNTNLALINGQVYQEGDTVSGVKILRISINEIVVLNNGKEEIIAVGK